MLAGPKEGWWEWIEQPASFCQNRGHINYMCIIKDDKLLRNLQKHTNNVVQHLWCSCCVARSLMYAWRKTNKQTNKCFAHVAKMSDLFFQVWPCQSRKRTMMSRSNGGKTSVGERCERIWISEWNPNHHPNCLVIGLQRGKANILLSIFKRTEIYNWKPRQMKRWVYDKESVDFRKRLSNHYYFLARYLHF